MPVGNAAGIDRGKQARLNATVLRDLALVFGLWIGLIVVLNRETLLPTRFLGDETTIQELAQQVWETPADNSYNTVALVYRLIGLADAPLMAGLVGFIIGCIPYFLVFRGTANLRTGRFAAPILLFGLVLTSIYMGTFSKEVFIVPIVIMFIVLKAGFWRMVLVLAAISCYAQLVRNYWFFLAASIVVLILSKRISGTWKATFWLMPIMVVAGSIVIAVVIGVPADFYRSSVNLFREASGDVNSLIPRYVEVAEPLGGIVNNLLSFTFLQLPLPLLLKLSPYYVIIGVVMGTLWIIFYKSVLRADASDLLEADDSSRLSRCIILLLSFVITQSFFEPDYGSALKHLTPLIPILLWIYIHSHEQSPHLVSPERMDK